MKTCARCGHWDRFSPGMPWCVRCEVEDAKADESLTGLMTDEEFQAWAKALTGGKVTEDLVTSVSEPWTNPNTGRESWYVDVGGETCVCFTPRATKLKIGEPLPEGWFIEAPKAAGQKPWLKAPAVPFRDAPAAATPPQAQAESINRSVALKAAARLGHLNDDIDSTQAVLKVADRFFAWLQGNKE